MHVFVCHAGADRDAAAQLRADLAQLGRQVTLDRGAPVGTGWWDGVLDRIQRCSVFIMVVSPDSVRSPGCLAELRYAHATRRPLLAVLARDAPLPPELADERWFDPARAGQERVLKLRTAVMSLPTAPPLPEPLPPSPPVPYLDPYRDQLDYPALDPEAQWDILRDLRARLRDEHERPAVWGLLVRLRARVDITPTAAAELEKLLAPGWQPDPERRVDRRYWDGQAWTTLVRHENREFNERRVPPPEATWPDEPVPVPRSLPAARIDRRRWMFVGAGIAIVVALIAGGFLLFRQEMEGPAQTVRKFVDAVNVGDTGALAEVTCARDRDQAEEFLVSGSRLTLERVNEGDLTSFTVVATNNATGRSDRRTYPLVEEAGGWRVCGAARP
ncbi:MAG: TIR domain-containing protein [Actinomycetota bacterium]|nr:TIR domain-containing protein [Actinomycetota bacterium]